MLIQASHRRVSIKRTIFLLSVLLFVQLEWFQQSSFGVQAFGSKKKTKVKMSEKQKNQEIEIEKLGQ